jgi:hypothetical protein
MSKTPLTDSARLSVSERIRFARQEGVLYELVPAKFARDLERDRARLIKALRWYAKGHAFSLLADAGFMARDALTKVEESE